MFGKRERGWRKKRKRGVSPIIATILLVAITVVLAAVLYVLITGLTTGGANSTPIGGSFSTSAAQQSSNSNCATPTTAGTCYSAQVQTAGSAATTANMHFSVASSSGGVGGFVVYVTDSSGNLLATYTEGASTLWSSTGTLPLTLVVGDYLVLSTSGGASIQADSFQAIGVNGLNGAYSISTGLP